MFGPKNPKRVAERQLNEAELHLLEVSSNLESYESQKKTLEDRIVRLRAYLKESDVSDSDRAVTRNTVAHNTDIRGVSLNSGDYDIGGKTPRAAAA